MIGEALQSHQLKWSVLFKFWLRFLHVIISFLNFMILLVLHDFGYYLKKNPMSGAYLLLISHSKKSIKLCLDVHFDIVQPSH